MEIMMDRRLLQDDNRGLFQGVTDNHLTPHSFYLVLERKTKNCKVRNFRECSVHLTLQVHWFQDEAEDVAASYPSLLAVSVRHSMINPYYRMVWASTNHMADVLSKSYDPVDKDLPCDVHIVNLRTMQRSAFKKEPADQAGLVLHRQGFNGCYKPVGLTCSTNGGKVRDLHVLSMEQP